MLFTRPRLEGIAIVLATAAACSRSEDEPLVGDPVDASAEASEASSDAAVADSYKPRDADSIDPSPLPIVCTAQPCATSLVTTFGASADDRSEGFCALLDDGTVACWGANGAGQLGRGDDAGRLDSAEPARVAGLDDVVSIDHTCALDKSGAIWCWGTGPFLREDAGVVTSARAPVKLDLPAATKMGVGHSGGCAVVSDGLRCWGSNADGQLAPLTTNVDTSSRLVTLPAGAAVRSIAVGRATFVLRDDGSLLTWGANPPAGRVSPIFPDPYPQAIDVGGVFMVDLVHDNACATAGGTGYCWGARVLEREGAPIDRALPEPLVTPEPIVQIATTRTHVIPDIGVQRYRWCATGASGTLYCWGFNESGQAGDGTQKYAFDPIAVEGLPERVAQVKTTPNTTCALLTNGKIHCWGANYYGQLGNGQIRGRSFVPVEVKLP